MKPPFEITSYVWHRDQPGQLEPFPIPYIQKGQSVFAIYNRATGQFFRWAYPHEKIAAAVANNLGAAKHHSPKHWGNIPEEVVIPRPFANLPGLSPSPDFPPVPKEHEFKSIP